MSVQSEIERLNVAKADIRTAIIDKGVEVADDLSISGYAEKINEISAASTEEYINVNLDCSNVQLEFYNGKTWEQLEFYNGKTWEITPSSIPVQTKTVKVKKGSIILCHKITPLGSTTSTQETLEGKVIPISIQVSNIDEDALQEPRMWYCFGDCSISYNINASGGTGGSDM